MKKRMLEKYTSKFIGHSRDGLSGKYIINREKGLGIKSNFCFKNRFSSHINFLSKCFVIVFDGLLNISNERGTHPFIET